MKKFFTLLTTATLLSTAVGQFYGKLCEVQSECDPSGGFCISGLCWACRDDCDWYGTFGESIGLDAADVISAPSICNDVCPATASGVGDPHFKTWTGERYDFHGVCDMVLLQNLEFGDNLGMDIHIRTKQTKSWSFISAAVLRIGENILEVMGGDSGATHWVDGVKDAELKELSGYIVTKKIINSKQHMWTVTLENSSIEIKTFKNFVRVDIKKPSEEAFGSSYGLVGAFGSGAKVGRDHVTIIDDANKFGLEWQVLPSEGKFFHSVEGPQAPEQCVMPKATSLRRRLSEIDISLEEAEDACARVNPEDFDVCVFDAIATSDKDMAGAY